MQSVLRRRPSPELQVAESMSQSLSTPIHALKDAKVDVHSENSYSLTNRRDRLNTPSAEVVKSKFSGTRKASRALFTLAHGNTTMVQIFN